MCVCLSVCVCVCFFLTPLNWEDASDILKGVAALPVGDLVLGGIDEDFCKYTFYSTSFE